jgi:hypothetical protein
MVLLLLIALATAAPSPSPTPLLKTIVTVKSSPFCGAFAAHVNAAIGSAVANDQTLGTTILNLRSDDLGGNAIERNNEEQRLENLADAIYHQYRAGEAEVAQLRTLAAKASDPAEKASLKASADALGGALYRQHLIQRDLDGFVAFLDTSDMRAGMETFDQPPPELAAGRMGMTGAMTSGMGPYWLPPGYEQRVSALTVGHESHDDDVRMAAAASADFQNRLAAVLQDEMTAGNHIEQASDHC